MGQWFVAYGKVKKGPFSLAELQASASSGALRATDMVLQVGTQLWKEAGGIPGLFPVPVAEPVFAVPASVAAPSALPVAVLARPASPPSVLPFAYLVAAVAGRHQQLVWIAAGSIGVSALVVILILIFGGRSSPSKTSEQLAQDTGVPLPSGQERVPQTGQPGGNPSPAPEKFQTGPKSDPGEKPPQAVPDVAKPVTSDDELPPVGPAKAAPVDSVAVQFKVSRAVFLSARNQARNALAAEVRKLTGDKAKELGSANEKDKAYQELFQAMAAFVQGGGVPSHPAFAAAVAEYWRTLEVAAAKFGEAGESGLAVYEKEGVTDPTLLQPLLAARLAAKHASLLGVWTRKLGGSNRREAWVIDFDERSGGFQVGGIDTTGGVIYGVYRGDKIEFKNGILSFIAVRIDGNTGKATPGGIATSLTLKDGNLRYETQGVKKPIVAMLDHTDEEMSRKSLVFRLKKGGDTGLDHTGPDLPASVVAPNDANAVWRRLAELSSFAYLKSTGKDPIAHEALYLPYKSKNLAISPGAYGGLTDLLTGGAPGAGANQSRIESLLQGYDSLAQAEHPYLKRAAEQGLAVCRARLRLALADEMFGNTPASSIREFQQKLFVPAIQYSFLREADRAELQESLERANPGYRVIVADGPMSAESRQKLQEVVKGVGGMMEDLKQRAVVSGLLSYADMAEVDRAAAFWQTWLLPLARRSAGPVSAKALVDIHPAWLAKNSKQGRYSCLHNVTLGNVSGQDLTSVVVEMIAENEWGEKAAHYYYFPRFEVRSGVRLLPHPRWEKRRLDFTNTVKLTWSVWADQGNEVGCQMTLNNPGPYPDQAGARKDYLDFDKRYEAEGEALGSVVKRLIPLPTTIARAHRLMREAAAPGSSYVFRLPGEGKTGRTLVLFFGRFDAEQGVFEAEIFDPGTRKAFQKQTPLWKGKLGGGVDAGITFGTDGGKESVWAFALVNDLPEIICPAADAPGAVFPVRNIPLFPAKIP